MSGTTSDLLITNAKLFDGESFRPGRWDVRAEAGRITAIAKSGTLQPNAQTIVHDASGATLTPGLIDCHIHINFDNAGSLDSFTEPFSLQFFKSVDHLERTLKAGVTSARDAGGADAGVREAIARGLICGPRLKVAITIMSQTGGHGDSMLPSGLCSPMGQEHPGRPSGIADGVAGVQLKTRELIRAGADHIKICSTGGVLSAADDPRHSQFQLDEISMIVAEAAAQGRKVMSHAQGTAGIKNAILAGVASIEHGIFLDEETIELMLERNVTLVPTLQAPRAVLRAADAGVPIPPAMVEKARQVVKTHTQAVAKAYQAGVTIAMGTDAGVGVHGENLEELELMSEVGMSTADVLKASTLNGAALIGDEEVGRIAESAHADFVLFDSDLEAHGLEKLRQIGRQVFKAGELV